MRLRFDKTRPGTSFRKFIGVLIAVIWTATALQPCLMASVPDPTAGHAQHGLSAPSDSGQRDRPACAHCPPSQDNPEASLPPAAAACMGDDQAPWLTQTKPTEAEKIYRLPQSPLFAQSPGPAAPFDSLADARLSLPLPGAAGPALFELFRSYLK